MDNFFAELKRRHIYRIAAAYGVVAWVLLQLFNNLTPLMKLPDWAGTLVLVLLAGGFPIALIFAWIAQLSSDGNAKSATGRLDWFLAAALLAVIALLSYQQYSPPSGVGPAQPASTALASADSQDGGISVAVLPFVNLSDDRAQEFFSDGMTEEITSALAKVPDLRVVGRTSAFQFKGQNKDLTAIGQALHASHLIEGSVRKDGEQVRITAQLIRADDGTHLWTESYNRELKGVFALQEDIARAIAVALQVPLGLKAGETLVTNRNIDPDAYQKFLRARQLIVSNRTKQPTETAILLLNQVIQSNPEYAPAWTWLANAYDLATSRDASVLSGDPEVTRRMVENSFAIAEAASQRALQLAPNLAIGSLAAGIVQVRHGKLLAAEQLYLSALSRDPDSADILQFYSNLLAAAGRLTESLAMKRKALVFEPLVPIFNWYTARILWFSGNIGEAAALAENLTYDGPALRAQLHASAGRFGEAADELAKIEPDTFLPGVVETAAKLLRGAPNAGSPAKNLPRLGRLSFSYLYTDAPERALEPFEGQAKAGNLNAIMYAEIWHPSYAALRKTERFKKFVRDAGLVEYWRAKGWPEFCHPTAGDDFECN